MPLNTSEDIWRDTIGGAVTAPTTAVTPVTTIPALTVATTLPAVPVDLQTVILTDSLSVPTYSWALTWSASASKWLFSGGAPFYMKDTTNRANTVDSTYEKIGGAACPAFTAPRNGTYSVRWGFDTPSVVVTNPEQAGISNNSTSAIATLALRSSMNSGGTADGGGVSAEDTIASVVQGNAMTFLMFCAAHAAETMNPRWLSVIPVFVT